MVRVALTVEGVEALTARAAARASEPGANELLRDVLTELFVDVEMAAASRETF